jgi:hypothetical protein
LSDGRLDLEQGVFTQRSARAVPLGHVDVNFHINRAGELRKL